MWVLFFFLKFVESEIFFQVSKYFPKAPKKNPGALFFFFVVLWVGLGGRQPDPPPSADLQQSFRRCQIVWAASPGDGGMGLPAD